MNRSALTAGFVYAGFVFAAGFVLGTIRVLALAPQVGALGATLVELPVILAIAWVASRWIVGRWRLPPGAARFVMGGTAFALLIGLEIATGAALGVRTLASLLADYRDLPTQLGLAGQIAFPALPWIEGRLQRVSI